MRLVKTIDPVDFEFSYSYKGISYKLPNAESSFEWSYFKYYEINGQAIYLYSASNRVGDIISEKIVGPDSFLELKDLITKNIARK